MGEVCGAGSGLKVWWTFDGRVSGSVGKLVVGVCGSRERKKIKSLTERLC